MKWHTIAAARSILAHEQGAIVKDWGGKLPIALIYPNSYYVGMSSLATHTLYHMLNVRPDVVCERVFHGYRRIQPDSVPCSLETQRPLAEFSLLAVTLSFELDYLNLVTMLRNAGIPCLAADRDERWPLLLAGGPAVSANPEPLAEVCDALVIGEVEEILPRLLNVLHDGIPNRRRSLLQELGTVSGVYVPALVGWEDAKSRVRVQRQWVRDLDAYPTHTSVFTPATQFGDMHLIEIARGCGRGCRFCLAGCIYRPPRERSATLLLEQASWGRRFRSKVGLVSAAVSDYSQIKDLVAGLRDMEMQVSVSSLRVDPLPESLLELMAASGTRTLTVAPEAGSERLRSAIHKNVRREDILRAAEQASGHDFPELKLYFMLGLPGEEDDDVQAIIGLVQDITRVFHRRVLVSVSSFVPKAHTPFERQAMAPVTVLRKRLRRIQSELRPIGVRTTSESPSWAIVQAVLARGDRRLGSVLVSMQASSLAEWKRALAEHGLHSEQFTRARSDGEHLPWGFVDMGVSARTRDPEDAHAKAPP